jgi:hypothetical protein
MQTKLLGIINVDFDSLSTAGQIFYTREILEKKWKYNVTVHKLLTDFKTAYNSVRREALYILAEFRTTFSWNSVCQ